jgi:methionyl aminopeptidase
VSGGTVCRLVFLASDCKACFESFIRGRNPLRQILKSNREINQMRSAGLLVWYAHQQAGKLIAPGVTTAEINQAIADVFAQVNAEPLFLNYPGEVPFPAESCISVNEEIVHGIPGKRQLQAGDIVSVDTGCRFKGWCGDAAVTHAVGEIDATAQKLLQVTSDVLELAIRLMEEKQRWSEVAQEMGQFVQAAGFSVVESFVGHAIGRKMHERPQVPNYYDPAYFKNNDFPLRPGTVLAIEPMVNAGVKEVKVLADHWTAVTQDRKLSAHFEHTVALTSEGARRLTGPPEAGESIEQLLATGKLG